MSLTILEAGPILWTAARLSRRARTWRRSLSSSSTIHSDGPYDILFCGSDAFSVESLKAVRESKDLWKSIHVLTPGDRRVRKRKIADDGPPLLEYAKEASLPSSSVPHQGISHYAPPAPFSELSSTNILLTASFGHIIPNSILSSFEPLHRLNVHPSLLPRYRGAAPIQWSIINGDRETGVSVQTLVERGMGIDGGDIVESQAGISIPDNATYTSMLPVLAETGGRLLVNALRRIREGTASPKSQDKSHVTKASKISHQMAQIDWSLSHTATYISRLYRGIAHQMPLWTTLSSSPIQLLDVSLEAPIPSSLAGAFQQPGTAFLHKQADTKTLLIACAPDNEEIQSWITVQNVKLAGRRTTPVGEWWNGLPDEIRKRGWIRFGE